VKKDRENEGTINEREAFERRPPRKKGNRFKRAKARKNRRRNFKSMGRKEKVRSNVTPRNVGVGSKGSGREQRQREGTKRAWRESIEKKEQEDLETLRLRSHLADQELTISSASWTAFVAEEISE